jgi:two-component system, OmpR family, phosphate regulon sensor histidine kinase PhoR
MRSSTLKWMVFVSALLVATIITVQLYWLNKIYSFEQRQFNNSVVKSIRGLLEDVQLDDHAGADFQKFIEHPSSNSFLIRIEDIPEKDSLIFYLGSELQYFGVLADCILAVYDKKSGKYIYEEYLPAAASHHPLKTESHVPIIHKQYHYIQMYFPHREQYIISQLKFWIIAASLLLLVLVAFSASLFYLYQQKTLNEVQKDFVNNFTHEFKTPLAVIKIASDVLISPSIGQQQEKMKRYATIVKEQTEHLQFQVERLLRTATSDKQSLQLDKKNIAVNEVIQEVLHQVEPMMAEKKVKVDLDLEESDSKIKADRKHIAMVLVNLIENAVKYSREPHVIIKTSSGNDDYSISIKDNGVGIEKKYIRHLFKRFFRVPTGDVHNVKGFGLGLNFVKKVVDGHHGKIIVNSLPGIGTEFKIMLPKT